MDKHKFIHFICLLALLGLVGYVWLNPVPAPVGSPITNKTGVEISTPETDRSFEMQQDSLGEVDVSITPVYKKQELAPWTFAISLNTHSVELDGDLSKAVELIDDAGNAYVPVKVEGAPPGGHHREAIVTFGPIASRSKSFEILVKGVGGVDVRRYKWSL